MLFSILFLGFIKTAIMNSTHSFTNFENLSSLYVPFQTNPSYHNPINNAGYKKSNKKIKSRRTRRDADVQTGQKNCKDVRVKYIKPNDVMSFECVCIKLLTNLCSKIINKINDDLPRTSLKQKEAKLSRVIFVDYVKKFINKDKVTNDSSNVIDYNYFLAEKLWFPIYLLSNKKFYSEDSKTLEDLQKRLIHNIEIEIDGNLENKIVSVFNIDNYRSIIKLIQTSFQVNDKNPCALGNSIDDHLKDLDDKKNSKIEILRKTISFFNSSYFKIICIILICLVGFSGLGLFIYLSLGWCKCRNAKKKRVSHSTTNFVDYQYVNVRSDDMSEVTFKTDEENKKKTFDEEASFISF